MPMIVHTLGGNLPAGALHCSGQDSRQPAETVAHLRQARGGCVCLLLFWLLTVVPWVSPVCTGEQPVAKQGF